MRNLILVSILILTICFQFLFSCQPNYSIETMQYVTNGQKLYATHCQNCHGTNGEGLGKLYPPLTDPDYLNEYRETLPCIIRHGMRGPLEISGQLYNETMPGIPELTDIDIAYILSYVTVRFGDSKEKFGIDEVKDALQDCLQSPTRH